MTTGTAVAESSVKSRRNWSPTAWDEADFGSTRSSGIPHFTPRNGSPSISNSATTARPTGTANRITNLVDRYQKSFSTGLCSGSGRPSIRRPSLRTSSASSRGPSSTIAAGVTTIAATATNATVATPAYANDFRKYIGNSTITTIDNATVVAENSTVRPAVAMVRISAWFGSLPSASSSR